MRRLWVILLCLCLSAGLYACEAAEQPPASATTQMTEHTYPGFPSAPETFTGMKEADLQPYFELAQETYKRYIMAVYIPEGEPELPQFPMQLSPLLRKYTELRFAKDAKNRYPKGLVSIETYMGEGWMGDAWQRSWKIIDGRLLCMPCVSIEFRYQGMDTASGSGEGVQMLIENPRNPTLVDWFDMDKFSWDRQMREGHYNLPDDADPWTVRQWPVSWNLGDPENWLGRCELKGDAEKIFD